MYLSQLRLLCFRIYQEASLELLPGVNLVLGQNGQGKTSLLEAISTLALTRSPRSGSLGDCASWGEPRMGVAAHLVSRLGDTELELRAERQETSERWVRKLRQDGDLIQPRQLLGRFRVVLFWPEDLLLVKGGPEPRRRLLDVVLSQLSSPYAEAATRYRRGVEHRNALLRRVRDGQAAPEELRPWTEALVEHGTVVMQERRRYLDLVQPVAAEAIIKIGESAELQLLYRPGLGRGGGWDNKTEPADALRRALARTASEEIARAQCVVGPHRDDFEVLLGGRPARQFASQGQQRSVVLALKVAEVRQHLSLGGETPLLLLDDVLSELDQSRRTGLIQLLSEELAVEQTLITSTEDPQIGGEVAVSQVLQARGGQLTRQAQPGWELAEWKV
ncbi:MAG TPA: DNA replication/repair protein RecF [Candidatus Dormibacteraeota bacterium]|nr:DNA replication/repair protein RecF [Candidatus Dormibacteraeota bacterium]